MGRTTCRIKRCHGKHYAKGFCQHHYNISDEVRRKDKERRQTIAGRKAQRVKNRKYNRSFKGSINNKIRHAGLPLSEKPKVIKAFSNFKGFCYCCKSDNPGPHGWVLDHKGKRFRGILCLWCNCAAGFLKDDIQRCKSMIQYLRRSRWI